MSEANKIKNPTDDKFSKAIGKMIRTSPIKLNDAVKSIRGKKLVMHCLT
jgi:ribosomal protein L22